MSATRRLERYPVRAGRNAMWEWPRLAGFGRAVWNTAVITLGRWLPWMGLKNALYRRALGCRIEADVAIAFGVTLDLFLPQRIRIGANSLIGYNTTILCHEFLVDEIRLGDVEIGRNVMIGANCTILPGVRIGDGAVVAAGSLVNRDIPPGERWGGVPARPLGEREELEKPRKPGEGKDGTKGGDGGDGGDRRRV